MQRISNRPRRFCHSVAFVLLVVACAPTARAQIHPQDVPTPHYFTMTLPMLQDGDFAGALESLKDDLKFSQKITSPTYGQVRWIDSICYFTQIGECRYMMGDTGPACENYTEALNLYLANSDWFKYVGYQAAAMQFVPRPAVPWGPSQRANIPIGKFQKNGYTIMTSDLMAAPVGQGQAAIVPSRRQTVIQAQEIARTLAIAIRRRAEILGPLSKYDPINLELEKVLGGGPCAPNSFAEAWVRVLHGLALAAKGDDTEAAATLNAGLLMEGRYEHQLTPIAMLELGCIALRKGDAKAAYEAFHEATISAMLNGDAILLAESFQRLADAHRMRDKSKPCMAMQAARQAIETQKYKSAVVHVALLNEVAEELLMFGDAKVALDTILAGERVMGRLALARSRYGARNQYLGAWAKSMLAYMNGKPAMYLDSRKHFENAMGFLARGSLRLWQLGELGRRFQSGQITTRGTPTVAEASKIFERLLTDPTAVDWTLEPMECMAMSIFTPPAAYEYWFLTARERQDKEKAFEIAELARRQRFYSAIPQGPRMLALRMLFEGDPAEIPQEALMERQSLAIDFEKFSQYSEQVKNLKRQLAAIPAVPKSRPQAEEQQKLLAELAEISAMQEAMLFPIALTRTKSTNVFPPVLRLEQIRDALPENTAMLVFFDSLGELYGFMLDRQGLQMWSVANNDPRAPTLRKLVENFLQALGNNDRNANQTLSAKDLNDDKWKKAGRDLMTRLLGDQTRAANFTELVVVPTGVLWYTPFEAMCVDFNKELIPPIWIPNAPISVRYAPSASLGVPTKKGRPVAAETVAIFGKIWPRKEESETVLNAIGRYSESGLRLALISSDPKDDRYRPLPSSATAYATQIRQLLVLDDIPMPKAGPLDWSPFTGDKGKGTNTVATWLQLPWGGPGLVVLPAFHTPAETVGKTNTNQTKLPGNGDELFYSSMALEACGAQTILLSRWRTGGRISLDLTGEFLKHYAEVPAAEAWRRTVLNVATTPLVPQEEPRVKLGAKDEIPIANHPFFWSSMILIDRGEQPNRTDEPDPDAAGEGELEKLE